MNGGDLRHIAANLEAGLPWRDSGEMELVSDVLDIARTTGAPRSRVLRVVADAWDDNDVLRREVRIAATSARTSAQILVWLPAATSVISALIGLETLGFLLSTPTGWACLVTGASSTALGWWWMGRLVTSIPLPPLETGIVADLVAEILSVSSLSSETTDHLAACAAKWNMTNEWNAVVTRRESSRETGVPIAGLLRNLAIDRRQDVRLGVREQIEALPARLLIPLGVCLFPAFVVLTVIPAVATMASGFFSSAG